LAAGLAAAAGAGTSGRSGGTSGRRGGGGGSRSGLNLHLGLFAHDDDDITTEAADDAFGEIDFADVNALANLELGDVDLDAFRKVFREAAHFDFVMDGFHHAAKLLALGLTHHDDGNVGMNFFISSHRVEIDMQDAAAQVVVLHFLHEGELVFRGAGDLERNQNVV
jgi:hypothetical protein